MCKPNHPTKNITHVVMYRYLYTTMFNRASHMHLCSDGPNQERAMEKEGSWQWQELRDGERAFGMESIPRTAVAGKEATIGPRPASFDVRCWKKQE